MVLLELTIIGGAVYYYKKHHKINKSRKAAFMAGNPYVERDGSVSLPPSYPGLPAYTEAMHDKVQAQEVRREYYADSPTIANHHSLDEKAAIGPDVRQIEVTDGKL